MSGVSYCKRLPDVRKIRFTELITDEDWMGSKSMIQRGGFGDDLGCWACVLDFSIDCYCCPMSFLSPLLSLPKRWYWAIALAVVSAVLPWPIAGLHKFYLGQPIWGGVYWLLWNTPIPRIACAIDAVWYFVQGTQTLIDNLIRAIVVLGRSRQAIYNRPIRWLVWRKQCGSWNNCGWMVCCRNMNLNKNGGNY